MSTDDETAKPSAMTDLIRRVVADRQRERASRFFGAPAESPTDVAPGTAGDGDGGDGAGSGVT